MEHHDWKRIAAELENLVPKVPASDELSIDLAHTRAPHPPGSPDPSQKILDHIAKALEDDRIGLLID